MTTITEFSQLDLNKSYSYADYLTWKFNDRVEILKGKISLMSPAPNLNHQAIERNLIIEIGSYLKNKKCRVFPAPFDVRLYNRKQSILKNKEIKTIVQPDVCVVCNPEILDKQGCDGAPDWIIEIVSKGNSKKDLLLKYELYQENGVGEYWLVYPYEEAIHQFILNSETQRYQLHQIYAQDGFISPCLFPDLKMDLTEIFAE
jgi:Uma2 family endonuclease